MSQFECNDEEDDGRNGSVSPDETLADETLADETLADETLADETLADEQDIGDGSPGGTAVGQENDGAPPQTDRANPTQEQPCAGALSTAPTLSVLEGFEPWRHDLTELGDARRLKDAFGPNVRWVKQKLSWIVYDGGRWHGGDNDGVLQQGARQVVDVLGQQVSTEERQAREREEAQRKCADKLKSRLSDRRLPSSPAYNMELACQLSEFLSGTGVTTDEGSVPGSGRKAWIKRCKSRTGLWNMIDLLRDEPGIAVDVTELDADPDLLGVVNGVLDLRTGQLRTNGRDDLITRTAATLYEPGAAAPQWERFLEAVQPDPEVRAFLGRAAGYSLTGHTREQCFFVLHGDGSTGKTTFIEAIRFVLGEYAVGLPASSLNARQHSTIPNDVARICGARFVPAAETNEFQHMDEALLKRLSGGDTMDVRFMHKEFFSFQPTHKLWIATNHLPHVQDTGDGFWRRPVLIPFNQKFTGEAVDKEMLGKLKAEAPGILAWIVRHCLEWRGQGLTAPPHLTQAVNEYRTEQDVVARFVADRCDVGESLSAPADALHKAYQDWSSVQGEGSLSGTAFGIRLGGLGYGKRRSSGCMLRCGLKINSPRDLH